MNDPLDIIAVGAHPDDVEIGCGGTLAALGDLGYRVGIVDLTDGEPTPNCPSPDVRLAEAAAAGKILGVHHRTTLPFTNRALFDSFEARVALAIEFRRHRPKLVIGLGGHTPTASPDHAEARKIFDAAVFYSRLTKWDGRFGDLPPHKIDLQFYYFLDFDAGSSPELAQSGQVIVQDITQTLDRKIESIRSYATQFPPAKEYLFERVTNLARAIGQPAGFGAGERFASLKPWATRDLMVAFR